MINVLNSLSVIEEICRCAIQFTKDDRQGAFCLLFLKWPSRIVFPLLSICSNAEKVVRSSGESLQSNHC